MVVSYNNIPEALVEVLKRLERIEKALVITNQSPNSIPEELLTITQAAQFLQISISTLYGKVCKRRIPFLKNGKRVYFNKADLIEWLRTGNKAKIVDFAKVTDTYLSTLKQKSNAA